MDGLSSGDYLGLEEWSSFYQKDYTKVGVVSGAFYDREGGVTQHWKDLQDWIAQAHRDKDKDDVEKQMFPPCNVEWSQAEGSRFWCTTKSGGITRDWKGVPRFKKYKQKQKQFMISSGNYSTLDSKQGVPVLETVDLPALIQEQRLKEVIVFM